MVRQILIAEFKSTGDVEIRLADNLPSSSSNLASQGITRCSPIYSLEMNPWLPDCDNQFHITYFIPLSAYDALAVLRARLASGLQKYIWYSIGLPSVMVIAPATSVADEVAKVLNDGVRARENWKVDNGTCSRTSRQCSFAEPVAFDPNVHTVHDPEGLDIDIASIVHNISLGLSEFTTLSAQFLPQLLPLSAKIAAKVNTYIQMAHRLAAHSSKNCDRTVFGSSHHQLYRVTDHLAQLQSSLAYLRSQAFSCVVPLETSLCLLPTYGLLGIGEAIKALHLCQQTVEAAFVQYPLPKIIRENFAGPSTGVDVLREIQDWESVWDGVIQPIDKTIATTSQLISDEPRPVMMFVSGRLGFKEARYSVSVPPQALTIGGSPRWTVMTLTHELMHSHVRSLLDALFTDNGTTAEDCPIPPILPKDYVSYTSYIKDRSRKINPESLKQSLRFAIYNFARWQAAAALNIASSERTLKDIMPTTVESLRAVVAESWNLANEILAHVLDLHYFYNGRRSQYMESIWRSWATVPGVVEEIDHYLLRSVVVGCTDIKGSISTRVSTVCDELKDTLIHINSHRPSLTLTEAIDRLEKYKDTPWGFSFYGPALYLSDVCRNFFFSSSVQTALLHNDQNATKNDAGHFDYTIDTGEFDATEFRAPFVLIFDRLRRKIAGADTKDAIEMLSADNAWLLLACAATKEPF